MSGRSKRKSTFVAASEYHLLRGFLRFLQALPYAWNRAFCRAFLRALVSLIPKRSRLIESQISACFPGEAESMRKSVASRSIQYLGDGLATFARIPLFKSVDFERLVRIEGFEHVEEAYRQKRGMITFTAHYGCWELMAVYVTRYYPRVAMLVRPLDNARLDAMVSTIRRSSGGGVIDSRRVFSEGLRLLRSNGMLGVLVDQNFYKGGVFVDFFGRAAATNTLVPILARRSGCAVLPMHNYWRDGKVHIVCEPPIVPSARPNRADAIIEDTQKMTATVERWIREDPSQWLWLHNRWKRRPREGDKIYDPLRGVTLIGHEMTKTTDDLKPARDEKAVA